MTVRSRLKECDESIVAGRLRKAEQFLEVAAMVGDLVDDQEDIGDALVTLCVHAGIAASDELSKVPDDGRRLGNDLRALLQMKTRAAYGAPAVTAEQRKRAWCRAEGLVRAAKERRAF